MQFYQLIEKHHPPTLLLFKDELLKFIENKQQQIHKKGISIGKVKGFIALLEHSMYHISCTRDVYIEYLKKNNTSNDLLNEKDFVFEKNISILKECKDKVQELLEIAV